MNLAGKKVLVGISSGIASYKVLDYLSKLLKLGVDLNVICTKNALNFVAPKVISAIIKKDVYIDDFADVKAINHVNLAKWADLVLIIPATANIIAKTRAGICDDLLSSAILAANLKPKIFVPAMNTNMYLNPITQDNIKYLTSLDNYYFIEPLADRLLCGDVGVGKMQDLETVIFYLEYVLQEKILGGKKIAVTYGATREFFDPVRFISNPSTGKMGYSFIYEALLMGAFVTGLNCNAIPFYYPPVNFKEYRLTSCKDLEASLDQVFPDVDILIMTAAVADYSPLTYSSDKLKKKDEELTLSLKKNPDLLASLKKKNQYVVGFAMETSNSLENAKEKLKKKNLDLIVLNDLTVPGAGFQYDTNVCTIIKKDLTVITLPKLTKREVARYVLEIIAEDLNGKSAL